MAIFTLPYLAHRWRDMKINDDPTGYEFIAEILEKDKETKKTVCWNPVQPFVGEGSPSIDDFEITSVDFESKHLLSGTIDVEFSVDIYFGCDGMDSQDDRTDTIGFKLDPAKKMILFTVTEQEPRDTFEEF
jgi:hypothetical protein